MSLFNTILRVFRSKKCQQDKRPRLEALENRINYHFTDQSLLFQAVKHRSFLTETGEERLQSNERLEMLGDSVLGLVVTDYLFNNFPDHEEGGLTNLKSLLVNRKILSQIARQAGLGKYIYLNEAEERSGGRERESILADAVEAIIGAIYLDGGLEAASDFIYENITARLNTLLSNSPLKNYKSILQEFCQSQSLSGPTYKIEYERGPDHQKTFYIAVWIDSRTMGRGSGHSKKNAEQKAAKEACLNLNLI
jgi:ribonuclease-3